MQYFSLINLLIAGSIFFQINTNSILTAENDSEFLPDSLVYKEIGDVKLKMLFYYPECSENKEGTPAMAFFYGGGWKSGDLMQFEQHARYFSSRGMICVLAEYRIESKHGSTPFDAVKDAKSAIRYLRAHAAEFGIDSERIVAAGGSAGGHLAAATANIEGIEEPGEDLSVSSVPNALILFNPVIDNGPNGYGYDRIGERYLEISPIHNIAKATPPTIFFLGDNDMLIPVSTAELYKQKVEDVGSRCDLFIYDNQEHGFFNYKHLKYYKATVFRTDQFLSSLGYISGEATILNDDVSEPEEHSFRSRLSSVPTESGFKMDGYYIWGGSVIKSGNTYHMFASRWPKKREFAKDYMEMSEIVRATSDNPLGPYTFQEVVIGERDSSYWDSNMAHNPSIYKIGDTFVLYYIGTDFTTIRKGSTNKLRRVGYATAKNIEGPWKRSDLPVIEEESNNPALLIEDDGRIKLMYRNATLRIVMASSASYKGPYKIENSDVWPVEKLEDFYLFKKDGRYHCICEDNRGQVTGHVRWGAHLVSDDGINDWKEYQPDIVYDHDIHFDDGSIMDCVRRERPQLFIEDGEIKYLFTGVYDGEDTWCQPVPLNPPYKIENIPDLKDTSSLNLRNGLPHIKQKIKKGKKINVAYVGGSITEQSGWRVYSLDWFRKTYPKAKFEQIQAAIGGTDSRFGVFRIDEHVLKYDPDIVFIEFAVNDAGLADDEIYRSVEGLVRKIKKNNAHTDICFIYTVNEPMLGILENGYLYRTSAIMENIAEYYKIPSINFGPEIIRLIDSGDLTFKGKREGNVKDTPLVFSGDGTHPFVETGHKIYFKSFVKGMEKILNSEKKLSLSLPEPLVEDNYEYSKLIPIDMTMLQGNWEIVTDSLSFLPSAYSLTNGMPEIFKAVDSTCTLKYTFEGNFLGFCHIIGPDCGKIKVEMDGENLGTFSIFDKYAIRHRLNYLVVSPKLDYSEHQLNVNVSSEKLNKKEILKPDRRFRYDDNPEKFIGYNWYLCGIMINERPN